MTRKCRAMVLVAPERMEMQTLVRSGKYPFEELITHRFPLAQAERAVRLVAGEIEGESPLKVVLDPKG